MGLEPVTFVIFTVVQISTQHLLNQNLVSETKDSLLPILKINIFGVIRIKRTSDRNEYQI